MRDVQVKVTQQLQGYDEPQDIRRLKRGDYFGEKALLRPVARVLRTIFTLLVYSRHFQVSLTGALSCKQGNGVHSQGRFYAKMFVRFLGEGLSLIFFSAGVQHESPYHYVIESNIKIFRDLPNILGACVHGQWPQSLPQKCSFRQPHAQADQVKNLEANRGATDVQQEGMGIAMFYTDFSLRNSGTCM